MVYRAEVRIVTEPEVRTGNRDGREFAVARCCFSKQVYDRELGANVRQDTYMGLVAFDELIDPLLQLGIGSRVVIVGELYYDEYIGKDGRPGRDRKCQLSGIEELPVAVAAPVEDEDPAYVESLVASGR